MTGLDKRKEERLLRAVKDLSKLPGNKRCADCTEKLPQYVNLTFNTFICTACSGIHREFSHRL
ncbi:adp-ribosylation factor gtpase-activating protein agd14 [Nannochloropsis gaditana]|uniref:Adp-ribosylation factor gtpase-activating protein agd14 n=1 Tax=Nannochloropsis gaditana TaxID=72520 RepID=W7U8B7_9STRA|nr:adp-ribosylation factor gtpase-activating protein agd14 [Nannochloropsis gaditana]